MSTDPTSLQGPMLAATTADDNSIKFDAMAVAYVEELKPDRDAHALRGDLAGDAPPEQYARIVFAGGASIVVRDPMRSLAAVIDAEKAMWLQGATKS